MVSSLSLWERVRVRARLSNTYTLSPISLPLKVARGLNAYIRGVGGLEAGLPVGG
jgi:hypothetical protein